MLNKEILIKDLDDICKQTDARWFCCEDIYTKNIVEDEAKFTEIFRMAGLLKRDILFRHYASLEYGGGLRFNYKNVLGSGYTLVCPQKYKALVVFAGFETDFDQTTIYHECAHLYQRKHGFFTQTSSNGSYRKYLKEVHANVFASMVMLLRAEDVLSFKQQQLYCLALDIEGFNRNSKESKFYISLPVVMELIKAVRREGRLNTREKFSKNGNLDFEKIAFWTADLVKECAYTSHEFYQIVHGEYFSSYDMLKQKAKAWHMLGERYIMMETNKQKKRKDDYAFISEQRRLQTDCKIKPLPEIDEKAKIINAVCAIDVLNTRLNQDFDIYTDFDNLISDNKSFYVRELSDEKAKKEALEICDEISKIHQKWRKNLFFKKLFSKIDHPDTRDEVWALKFRKEKEIFQTLANIKTIL
ncbi:MAG: hypothetical protein J5895_03320 [Alphaproteobacteria bacterium]|nr:hypothetical protein [Alphaproteobacteria bacterium]